MLIRDICSFDGVQILSESQDAGTMRVRGVIQRAEAPNKNNRRYSRSLLEREIKKLTPLVNERKLCGELDHPDGASVRLSNVSHVITNVGWRGNDVIGEMELLNTPAGKTAQALVKAGIKIGVSSRGTGTLSEGVDGINDVNEDFDMVTFDLVADPSTEGAYPELSESKRLNEAREIKTKALAQAKRERLFVNLLKKEIKEAVNKTNEAISEKKVKVSKPEYPEGNKFREGERIGNIVGTTDDVKAAVKAHYQNKGSDYHTAMTAKKVSEWIDDLVEGSTGVKRLNRKKGDTEAKNKIGMKMADKFAKKKSSVEAPFAHYMIKTRLGSDKAMKKSDNANPLKMAKELGEGSLGRSRFHRLAAAHHKATEYPNNPDKATKLRDTMWGGNPHKGKKVGDPIRKLKYGLKQKARKQS